MLKSGLTCHLINVQFFLCIIICIAGLFQKSDIVSLCFTMTFIVLFVLVFNELSNKNYKVDKNGILLFEIVIIAFICVFFNSKNWFGFDYIKKYLMFISTLLFFHELIYVKNVNKKTIKWIYISFISISLVFVGCFFLNKDLCYMFRGRVSRYLTFGMQNPNKTGLYMLCLAVYAVVLTGITQKKIIRIICLAFMPFYIYFIILTEARNSLIAFVLFVLFSLFFGIRKRKIPNSLLIFSLWYPAIFVLVYLLVINNRTFSVMFDFFISEGKTLTSRYSSWMNGLEYIKNSPLFGSYYEISNGTGQSQMLNTHLDILVSYGILVFVLTMTFLKREVQKINKLEYSSIRNIALMGFFACIFAGAGEAALFSGGTGFHILVGGFLLLARDDIQIENIEKEYRSLS